MKHMRTRTAFVVAAVSIVTALALPGMALAHGKDGAKGQHREHASKSVNSFGIRVQDNARVGMGLWGLSYEGIVTAVSATGFTVQTPHASTYTVNTANAKIVRLPNTTIALSDVAVNDRVSITGTLSGSTINASVVFDLKPNVKPAVGKGTITAVNGSTLTVQTKNNTSVTVNTDANTQVVKKDGTTGTVAADATTGAKVKLSGLWDGVLNVFNALKIKIK